MHRSSGLPALSRALSAVLSVAVVAAPLPAIADEAADLAKAKELFSKARDLYKAENYSEACPLFEESEKLEPALGTELNLALCWAKVGKLLDAARMFDIVLGKTTAPSEAQRHQIAEDGARDVAARIAKVQIDRGPLSINARIQLDGVELLDTSAPIPVDPGEHKVTGQGAKSVTFTATEGQVMQITLAASEGGNDEPDTPGTPSKMPKWRKNLPFYLGASGAGLIATSFVFGIITLSKKSSALDKCDKIDGEWECPPEGQDGLASARTFSHISTGMFLVGAGALGAGIYLYFRDRKQSDAAPPISAWATPSGAGVVWGATW
jgi:hypothetical protein